MYLNTCKEDQMFLSIEYESVMVISFDCLRITALYCLNFQGNFRLLKTTNSPIMCPGERKIWLLIFYKFFH